MHSCGACMISCVVSGDFPFGGGSRFELLKCSTCELCNVFGLSGFLAHGVVVFFSSEEEEEEEWLL